ncbi:hypothetical protein Tco_0660111 [Tanacetum coccineum]
MKILTPSLFDSDAVSTRCRLLQCLTFVFSILTFSVLLHYLHYLHFLRTLPFSVKTFLRGNAFWEWVPFFLNGNPGDSDLSRHIFEKTLRVVSGLSDMLRERLDLRLLPGSPLKFGVLDSECRDASWIFEFLLEHPSKLRQAFTSFSLSCYAFSW